ncbi:unnamed protein product [Rhizoctonia solani]|uniref:Phosphoglycerate mutase-like protein n=1 Tax=Rhizoctonia solani TaxID=456999 RepID=A0A8H3ANA6_9AGAM|nr:unnamed protein product [Rhizoctonia solani]CAE6501258.1 unnamed protein product [Rhizoctonia solani]
MGLLSEKKYDPAPSDFKLEQVHVYIRHGERTPWSVPMEGPPANIPRFWNACGATKRYKAAVMGENGMTDFTEIIRVNERRDGYAQEGECISGELTDSGRKSSFRVGQELRKLYIERLGFLPDVLDSHKPVYFRPLKLDNLFANVEGCGRLEELLSEFKLAATKDHNPKLEKLGPKLSKYIKGRPITVDTKPRLIAIIDTIRAANAHGVPIPPEFKDPNIFSVMESAICDVWFRGYKDEEFRRLAMGRLLAEVSEVMSARVNGMETPKIRLLACHTSLIGLCQTLGVFDNRWPKFTASVTFELFSKSAPSSSSFSLLSRKPAAKYFVRMRYQNRNMALPACAAPGDHLPGSPEFCTLAAFQEHIRTMTPEDWKKECIPKKPR